jgi:hypothetical protein
MGLLDFQSTYKIFATDLKHFRFSTSADVKPKSNYPVYAMPSMASLSVYIMISLV